MRRWASAAVVNCGQCWLTQAKGECSRQCSNWRRANGVTRAPRAGPTSASPRWKMDYQNATNSMIRSACCGSSSGRRREVSVTIPLRQALLALVRRPQRPGAPSCINDNRYLAAPRSELRRCLLRKPGTAFLAAHGRKNAATMTPRQTEGARPLRRLEARRSAQLRGRVCKTALHWDCNNGSLKGSDAARANGEHRSCRRARDRSRLACQSQWLHFRMCREHRARLVERLQRSAVCHEPP